MMPHNNLKDSSSFDPRQAIASSRMKKVQARLNIHKTRTTKVIQNTTANTNNHRKVRNSRERNRKLVDPPNDGIYDTMQSPSEPTTVLRKHNFGQRLWQSVGLIMMLILCGSINVSFAIIHHSHSLAAPFTRLQSTATTQLASNELITTTSRYSQPFTIQQYDNDGDSFRPIIPKDINPETISQNVFTKHGQYRVFENVESDLRAMRRKDYGDIYYDVWALSADGRKDFRKQAKRETLLSKHPTSIKPKQQQNNTDKTPNAVHQIHQTQRTDSTFLKITSNKDTKKWKMETFEHPSNDNRTIENQHIISNNELPSSMFSHQRRNKTNLIKPTKSVKELLVGEMKDLENLLAEYLDDLFNKGRYQPKPELVIALQKNFTEMKQDYEHGIEKFIPKSRTIRQAINKPIDGELSVNIPRALESGRLLFFAGLKKVMWPLYMGLQVLKSLMLALLLPTIIGSFGKLLGKGISSGSAPLFIRPMDEPQDLDFRDNNFNFDDDSNKFMLIDDAAGGGGNVKDTGYAYNQAEASQAHNQYAASINQQALSRYSLNERQQLMQDSYLSALQSLGAASFKNSNSLASGSSSSGLSGLAGLTAPSRQKPAPPANMNTFQQFQKVPASSLLLSNYDPFYSPLLSRLDSVFAQLKLNSDDEACREKLICLMYANPAKYAPYSNLVSAQLSRELNELRKPTSDNPDILRFFKYMRAAKDGQDGIDCEKTFDKCKEFKDFENPAMVSTYHDINKLVQARKIS